MTETPDQPDAADAAQRLDDFVATIRTALAVDASAETRTAGAIACRAILGALDPTNRSSARGSATPSSPMATSPASASRTSPSPIAALLGAIGQIPREQLLEVIGGLRWFLGQQGPTYFPRPAPAPPRPQGGGP